jgi:hypothetical protein
MNFTFKSENNAFRLYRRVFGKYRILISCDLKRTMKKEIFQMSYDAVLVNLQFKINHIFNKMLNFFKKTLDFMQKTTIFNQNAEISAFWLSHRVS